MELCHLSSLWKSSTSFQQHFPCATLGSDPAARAKNKLDPGGSCSAGTEHPQREAQSIAWYPPPGAITREQGWAPGLQHGRPREKVNKQSLDVS